MLTVMLLLIALVLSVCSAPEPAPTPAPIPTTSPTPAPATTPTPAEVVELRAHSTDPIGSYRDKYIWTPMKERVEEATQGRVTITVFPSNTLSNIRDAHDHTVAGVCDIAWAMSAVSPGRYPIFDNIVLPGLGFISAEQASMCLWHIVKTFPQLEQGELKDVKLLFTTTTSPMIIGTTDTPVRKLEDLKGLKIRSAGANPTELLKVLGASPAMMPMSDVYSNLEKGVIDGWNAGWDATVMFNFIELTKYYTEARTHVGAFFIIMNLDKWNALPPDVQSQMEGVFNDDWIRSISQMTDKEDDLSREAARDAGAGIFELSPEDYQKLAEYTRPLQEAYTAEVNDKGLPGDAIMAEIKKFVKEYK